MDTGQMLVPPRHDGGGYCKVEPYYGNPCLGRQVGALFTSGRPVPNGLYPGPQYGIFNHGLGPPQACEPPKKPMVLSEKEHQVPIGIRDRNRWIVSRERLSWDNSPVASYNPDTKMFRCVACNTIGFLSRIAEHYLGTHANAKVFQCPRCPYSSAWSRCVRMHLSKHHGVPNAPSSLWKGQPLLDEILRILQNLKNAVEVDSREKAMQECSDKRYMCPKCPYATDRRDLYSRHENIHREDKPFHCYVCFKMFNRADHVKKHFFRIHKGHPYDVNLIRRYPPRSGNSNHSMNHSVSPWQANGLPWYNPPPQQQFNHHIPLHGSLQHRGITINKSEDVKPGRKKGHKTFLCSYCPWQGVDSWCLRRHLNTHIKPFSCPLCEYKAARSERLATHILKVHNKHACHKCSFISDEGPALQKHMRECHTSHSDRNRLVCGICGEVFQIRSELESHSLLAHNKTLMECNIQGCSFRSTDPAVLDFHRHERHGLLLGPTEEDSLSGDEDTLCRICGCEFLDSTSLQTHVELLHQEVVSLKVGKYGNRHPYRCAVCNYTCKLQQVMMEHMRIHIGLVLRCRAGDGCTFCTPYDSVLREHVLWEHDDEDCIIRCPHCGHPCSTRRSFMQHYQDFHHPVICQLCRVIEQKHFKSQKAAMPCADTSTTGSSDASSVKPSSQMEECFENHSSQSLRRGKNGVETLQGDISVRRFRRSRKQSTPRKIIHSFYNSFCSAVDSTSIRSAREPSALHSRVRDGKFFRAYLAKLEKQSIVPLHSCKLCHHCPPVYRHQRNLLLHILWYHNKKHTKCKTCSASFKHRYQLLLHARKDVCDDGGGTKTT